jgi:hypothetical protein
MPRASDASFDAGDDYIERYEEPERDTDAYRAAMRQPDGGVSKHDNGVTLEDPDPGALAKPPFGEPADEAGESSAEADGDVPDDWLFGSAGRQGDQPITDIDAEGEDSPESTDSVIAESLSETVEAAEQFTFEKGLELLADVVHPGAGRLINIAFMIKEFVGDAQALASPDSPRNLHVPLLQVTGGLTVDLNVHLHGADGSKDDAPLVSGFLSPGDGGLFGGWALEVDRPSESDEKETPVPDQNARPVGRPSAEQAERVRRQESPASPVIEDNLSLVKRRAKDPRRRAVALREAAARLRTRLYAWPEFAAEPILVVYDPLEGLGMWLVKPHLSGSLAGRRIVIRLNPVTGMMTVFTR